MKIVILIDHLLNEHAGTENQVCKLIRGLGERHEILLVCLLASPWIESESHGLPCRTIVLRHSKTSRPWRWWELITAIESIRKFQPDIVHTFFPIANSLGVLMARLASHATIVTSRRDFGIWMSRRYLFATRFSNRYVDWVVTNAERVRALTVKREGFPADRIAVIPNAVDIDGLRLAPKSESLRLRLRLGIPSHHKVIGHVANFRMVKRQDTLVRALARVLKSRDDVSVLFVGTADDEMFPEVQRLVSELGLQAHIVFAVADGDIADYLALFDIGVNSSESEGLSNAVIEYMTAMVPSVVTDGGGNTDLVRHGENGLVFTVGDDNALAAHLAVLLDDPELRKRLARSARLFVEGEMAMKPVLDRFEAMYRSIALDTRMKSQGLVRGSISALRAAAKSAVLFGAVSPYVLASRRAVKPSGVTVLMYHEIGRDEDSHEAWTVVRQADFRRQLDYVQKHYDIISLADALERVSSGAANGRPAAVLTFDDGNAGDLERMLPVVQNSGAPVTIFVSTMPVVAERGLWFNRVINALPDAGSFLVDLRSFGLSMYPVIGRRHIRRWSQVQVLLEAMKTLTSESCELAANEVVRQLSFVHSRRSQVRPLTEAGIKELARCPLVDIGAHTHGHEILTMLPLAEADRSISTSRTLLQGWTGKQVAHFAYPSGIADAKIRELVQRLGFNAALGSQRGLWSSAAQRFEVPRIAVGRFDSLELFKFGLVHGLKSVSGRSFSMASGRVI